MEDENGQTTPIPDERPYGQRLHDAFDEACGRLLKMNDQPGSGGTPTSVIVTIQLEDLLAKAGLAETGDGSQLTADQLLRIADEAEIWPTIINQHNVPLAVGRTRRLATPGQTMALTHQRRRMLISRMYSSTQLLRPTPHPGLDPRRAY